MRAHLVAALSLLVVTAACKKEPEPQATPEASAGAAAGIDAKPGLAASEGKLLLPPVSGRPAAAYFTLVNGGDKPVTLAAVSVASAERAEMHETVLGAMQALSSLEVQPGETVSFTRGGKHVMIFGLAPPVTAGGSVEMTLTFTDGDKLSVPLKVEAMANAMGNGGEKTPIAKGVNEGGGTASGVDMGHGDPH